MSRAEVSTGEKRNGHLFDWYVDDTWVSWQLFEALGRFEQERAAGEAIWDPCIGSGRTMVTFAERGFRCAGSDIVFRLQSWHFERGQTPCFYPGNFLERSGLPVPCSIVMNPPYSYNEGIAEAFVRHSIALTARRVCAVLPLKWLGSQGRFKLFMQDHPPQAVLVLSQRPSMPPGDMIEAMGKKAFKGGVVDYAWFVWNVLEPTEPGGTRLAWLPPLDRPDLNKPIEGLA